MAYYGLVHYITPPINDALFLLSTIVSYFSRDVVVTLSIRYSLIAFRLITTDTEQTPSNHTQFHEYVYINSNNYPAVTIMLGVLFDFPFVKQFQFMHSIHINFKFSLYNVLIM